MTLCSGWRKKNPTTTTAMTNNGDGNSGGGGDGGGISVSGVGSSINNTNTKRNKHKATPRNRCFDGTFIYENIRRNIATEGRNNYNNYMGRDGIDNDNMLRVNMPLDDENEDNDDNDINNDDDVDNKTGVNDEVSLMEKITTGQQQESNVNGNPRNKCALRPGHSLMDWIRLGSSGCDLAGTKGVIRPISHAELALHSKKDDAWLAIRGKCYNVTRYMDFHPGGAAELMKGIGIDATKIFDEVHAWVNYEQLLSKCYVGPLLNTATIQLDSNNSISNNSSTATPTSSNGGGGVGNDMNNKSSLKLTNRSSTIGQFKQPSSIILPFSTIGASVSANTSPTRMIDTFGSIAGSSGNGLGGGGGGSSSSSDIGGCSSSSSHGSKFNDSIITAIERQINDSNDENTQDGNSSICDVNDGPSSLPTSLETSTAVLSSTVNSTLMVNNSQQQSPTEVIPRFDWIQKTNDIIIIFYTKAICNPGVNVIYTSNTNVMIRVIIERIVHLFEFNFLKDVHWPSTVKLSNETGKIEIIFKKCDPALWTSFGTLDRRKAQNSSNSINSFNNDEDNDGGRDNKTINTNEYCILSRVQITHDSYAIILIPKNNAPILQTTPIGYHISVTSKIEDIEITRSYTPIPSAYMPSGTLCPPGCISLLVKSYETGNLSTLLTTSDLTDKNLTPSSSSSSSKVATSPILYLSYPKGNFQLSKIRSHNRIALLAAGSGITPMLSILDYIQDRFCNKLEAIVILYFNRTEQDIWCRERFDQLASIDHRIKLTHILSNPPQDDSWKGKRGRISLNLIETLVDKTSSNYSTFCCVCGPVAFNDLSLKLLEQVNFDLNDVHIFRG